MINFSSHKLPSGLNYIEAPLKDTEAVTILVLVKVGSRFEEAPQNGISHFLEHLFFKGTEKRPSTLLIAKELDAMGAKYNAFTGEEVTGFYIQTASQNFKKAWDILSDMIKNPLLDKDEIERERGVILEEMNMYYDTPQIYVQELAKQAVYGDTPLGRDIIGTRKTVGDISREQISNYRQSNYTPSNMTVVICGQEDGGWRKVVEEFSKGESGEANKFVPMGALAKGPSVSDHLKKTDQTHLILNYKTFPVTDPRWPTLEVLTNIFGGQMSSRLFIEVRERRGLAYYIAAHPQNFFDTGLLSVSAGVRTGNVDEAVEAIIHEARDLSQKSVEAEELQRAKDNLIGHLALSLEGSFKTAEFLADQLFYEGKIRQPEEIIDRYKSVTSQDIMKLAREIFGPQNTILTLIGPETDKQKNKLGKIIE